MRAILTYHSIDTSGSAISVHPEAFERHLLWLRSGRVRVTTIEELLALPATEDAVAITFDDGFVNFSDIAAPRLAAHGLPVTLFVVSGRVGRTNAWNGRPDPGVPQLQLLAWSALAQLGELGVKLGAHTRTHADLTRIDAIAVEDEVSGSADMIERETGVRPTVFAYPYGRLNRSVSAVVAKSFRYACTTDFGVLAREVTATELPRLDMYYFQHSQRLTHWGSPAFARYVRGRNRLRRLRDRFA
jgi:peptidoglycan/xylan/chitin deacetylase (PgdA/CDA1 family)